MSKKKENNGLNHFTLHPINPLTENQKRTFQAYSNHDTNLLLHGVAGTGKTFISLYLAMREILVEKTSRDKIIVIRSVVPSREMGFMPGSMLEKIKVYEEPYKAICDKLFSRGDGYEILKQKNLLHFSTTSFLRGLTFENAIVIVDECQNLNLHELDTVITRMGDNCRIIFSGDFRQTDLTRKDEKDGLLTFMRIIDMMHKFERIEFGVEDIVRSALVKAYIIAKLELGIT